MKSIKSSSNVKSIVKENYKRFWPFMFVSFIMVFTVSVILMINESNEFRDKSSFMDSLNNLISAYAPVLAIISLGAGILMFNYLQNKKESNFIHSLPITRKELFIGYLLSGIRIIWLTIVVNLPFIIHLTGGNILMIVQWFLISTIAILNIYAITVVSGFLSGNILMHLFNTAFFNMMAVVLVAEVNAIFNKMIFGYVSGSMYSKFMTYSNVIGALLNERRSWGIVIGYGIVTVMILVVSYVLYKKRKIENTGESLVFGWIRFFIMSVTTFMGMILFSIVFNFLAGNSDNTGIDTNLIVGLILGFITSYIIMWIMIYRNRNLFSKKSLKSMAVLAVIFTIILGSIQLDVFGYGSKTIPVEKVKSSGYGIFMDIDTSSEEKSRFSTEIFKDTYENDDVNIDSDGDEGTLKYKSYQFIPYLSSKENIKSVEKIHSMILSEVKSLKQEDSDEDNKYNCGLTVKKNNGNVTNRLYPMASMKLYKDITKECKKIYESKEFKDKYRLSNLIVKIKGVSFVSKGNYQEGPKLSQAKIASLIKAMDKDFKNRTYEDECKLLKQKNDKATYFEFELLKRDSITVYVSENDKYTKKWIRENIK